MDALDINIQTPFKAEGTAYYRLTKEIMEFFSLCHEKHTIVGFSWDPENPKLIGVILRDPAKEEGK